MSRQRNAAGFAAWLAQPHGYFVGQWLHVNLARVPPRLCRILL